MELNVLWMYHDVMDLYGDRGNIQTLKYRCEKRGIDYRLDTCGISEEKDYTSYDLIFIGGGADKEQKILSQDLLEKKVGLKKAFDAGVFFLLICGGYQLFGEYYLDSEGNKIPGLGFYPHYTVARTDKKRCVGNIVIDAYLDDEVIQVFGFENHGGQTHGIEKPLGKVIVGHGNQYESKWEGIYDDTVLGTYIHGPLLPRNAKLADFIIKKILVKKYGEDVSIKELDNQFEDAAINTLIKKLNLK